MPFFTVAPLGHADARGVVVTLHGVGAAPVDHDLVGRAPLLVEAVGTFSYPVAHRRAHAVAGNLVVTAWRRRGVLKEV